MTLTGQSWFRFKKRLWQYATRPLAHRVPVYFMIYDTAGEDMKNVSSKEHFYRFIHRATGIIFLIDPFDYPGLRAQLPQEIQKQLKPPAPSPSRIVDEVLKLFRSTGASASRDIATPVAFALTKSDLFGRTNGMIYPQSPILRDSSHPGGFDLPGSEELHREVIESIRQWDSSELIEKAKNNFTNHRFFTLSALGSQPKEMGKTKVLEQSITPLRIADPLLWLLWKRGYIPTARQ